MLKFLFVFVLIIIVSCKKNQEKKEIIIQEVSSLRTIIQHPDSEKVLPDFQKEISSWSELEVLKNFLVRFKKASPTEVLSNAIELKELVKILKESTKPELLNTPSFETRVNILENEVLRLADMTKIPAISTNEVNTQVDKIITSFSAINSKINTVFTKKKFEDEITIDISSIGLDSTKIDTISKKAILKNMEKKVEK